jgi:hypothetical protein
VVVLVQEDKEWRRHTLRGGGEQRLPRKASTITVERYERRVRQLYGTSVSNPKGQRSSTVSRPHSSRSRSEDEFTGLAILRLWSQNQHGSYG